MRCVTPQACPGQDTLTEKKLLAGRTRRNVRTIIFNNESIQYTNPRNEARLRIKFSPYLPPLIFFKLLL